MLTRNKTMKKDKPKPECVVLGNYCLDSVVQSICDVHRAYSDTIKNRMNGQSECPECAGTGKCHPLYCDVPLNIICKDCGTVYFETPKNFISGVRCPTCKLNEQGFNLCNSRLQFLDYKLCKTKQPLTDRELTEYNEAINRILKRNRDSIKKGATK